MPETQSTTRDLAPARTLITLPRSTAPVCNVCGGEVFMRGPNDRLSATRKPPRCVECLSLERHRQLRLW